MTHCYSSANSKGEYIAAQSQSTSISRRPITGPGGWSAEILLIFDENVTLPFFRRNTLKRKKIILTRTLFCILNLGYFKGKNLGIKKQHNT